MNQMKLICIRCGKIFQGNNEKFCSLNCEKAHLADLDRRLREAIKKDPGHTEKLSK